ncbi:hypothetical protein G7Z12_37600 [Streptomyces sp. ID38640]|uniref:hypothetical protein n=1 Tax=Streptomyces sp. ID38640 TaxID=1265399 RepID=UPI00140EA192|nr:hypothetical protein [Streptomyces sp. ID38640]QIK04730.1 hypothetical protein G7Z12_00140 [Streptomyces sp. ID38640]QIK10895.1 hypothetical protein G7Z12_37435 [Streptomyces sp. ID38640]QIK10916.1 hypothetical protein G7Z12_37600 [Streptomyces sp. ID38640]
MKKTSQSVCTLLIGLACVLGMSASAHAASDYGKKYHGCKNYVKVWRSGGKIYAYAKQTCNKRVLAVKPTVALSANGGKFGFVTAGKACKFAKTCKTKKVSLKAKKGRIYRASNSGTATTGRPRDDEAFWPKRTVAHATYRAK